MPTTAKLNQDRQQTLAHLVASGVELSEAASQLGISVPSAKVIARSPLFEALVKKYQREEALPATERLLSTLEQLIENDVLPRLRELVQSERETTALSACRASAELYKSLKGQDKQAVEATVNIVLSERETATLQAITQMDDVIVPEYEEVQTAQELYESLLENQDA